MVKNGLVNIFYIYTRSDPKATGFFYFYQSLSPYIFYLYILDDPTDVIFLKINVLTCFVYLYTV